MLTLANNLEEKQVSSNKKNDKVKVEEEEVKVEVKEEVKEEEASVDQVEDQEEGKGDNNRFIVVNPTPAS